MAVFCPPNGEWAGFYGERAPVERDASPKHVNVNDPRLAA